MRIIFWFVRIAVFLVVLAFALNNQHVVNLFLLPGSTLQTPLVWAIAGAFVLGTLFGVLAMLPLWLRARKLAKQQLKLHTTSQDQSTVPSGNTSNSKASGAKPVTKPNNALRGSNSDELGV
jgi:putative membrane protein